MKKQTPGVAIGVVARPHGVKGELRVRLHNRDSDVLLDVDEVELEGHGRVAVASARRDRIAILLALEGFTTRDEAEALRGLAISVPRAALPPPAEDEYYFCDLVGLEAVDAAGTRLGEVVDVAESPGHATLVVKCARGTVEVPLADVFVVAVDVAGGRIVLQGIDDLA